jgi:hypothetical protein
MWGRKRRAAAEAKPEEKPEDQRPQRLKDALRKARIESAERTGIVVDLQDAEVARLELLNEALEPVFGEIPPEVELFDRGISRGEMPRLWIDAIAHVGMGRDKRIYRFVQDTRYGRKVLAESANIPDIVQAVTKYLAQRLVERERALADGGMTFDDPRPERRRRRGRTIGIFLLGLLAGIAAVVVAALLLGPAS